MGAPRSATRGKGSGIEEIGRETNNTNGKPNSTEQCSKDQRKVQHFASARMMFEVRKEQKSEETKVNDGGYGAHRVRGNGRDCKESQSENGKREAPQPMPLLFGSGSGVGIQTGICNRASRSRIILLLGGLGERGKRWNGFTHRQVVVVNMFSAIVK